MAGEMPTFIPRQAVDTKLRIKVEFDKEALVFGINQAVGVDTKLIRSQSIVAPARDETNALHHAI